MEFIKTYVHNMKEEQPEEYAKLMKGFESEEQMLETTFKVAKRAVNSTKGELSND